MNILHISEYYPPYSKGGGEISASIINKEISKKHKVTVLCSEKAKSFNINSNNIKFYTKLKSIIPDLNDFKDIIEYLFFVPYLYPIWNILIVNQVLKNKKEDIIQIEYNSYLYFPLVFYLLLTKNNVVLSIRDGSILCPNTFVRGSCLNENLKEHKCLKELMTKNSLWPRYFEMFRFIYAILKYYHHKLFRYLIKKSINRSQNIIIITISEYMNKSLVSYGINKDKIFVNSIPLPTIQFTKRKKIPYRFVYAGRLAVEKGLWIMIKAFQIVQNKYPKSELIIIGDGYLRNEINTYIKKHDINIKLLGKLSYKEVLEYYSSAEAILAPSIWPEPFGRFILDSHISLTPLITTKVGGVPEKVEHRVSGLIVEPKKQEKFALNIELLLKDKRLYKKILKSLNNNTNIFDVEYLTYRRLSIFHILAE